MPDMRVALITGANKGIGLYRIVHAVGEGVADVAVGDSLAFGMF
jgi:NAD(P)-dependent dehydrogenase (short-subunit alcohol dehydrogenase family)